MHIRCREALLLGQTRCEALLLRRRVRVRRDSGKERWRVGEYLSQPTDV
jgi:hypothetical protein